MSQQEPKEEQEKKEKDQNIEFIEKQSESIINHLVRQDQNLKGVVSIEAQVDETYNIKLHRGTENKARTIENVDKDELIDMIKDNL